MRAIAKALAAAALLQMAFSPASEAADDPCGQLALMQPKAVSDSLKALSGEVFGKSVDLWTTEDFRQVVATARACHGKPQGMRHRVNAGLWQRHMEAAAEAVLPVSARTASIRDAYAPRWTMGEVPSCLEVLGWRRDPVWNKDNSEEIFGLRFRTMDAEQRALAAGFARECVPVMEEILEANKMPVADAAAVANDIEESARREGEAAAEDPEEIAPRLRVEHEGERVPLAYLGETSRRMVAVANHAEKTSYRLTTEQLIMLSTWSDKVRSQRNAGPERLYAERIRDFVREQMFSARRD